MSEVYKYFSRDHKKYLDYSDESMLELYYSESYGDKCSELNGFYHGKKLLNISVAMWKEDIYNGLLRKYELYDDPDLPDWWLDKVLKNFVHVA